MKALNLDIAGEFLVMAATLLYVKSRSLLPRHDDDLERGEDPEVMRAELSRRLVEYERMKEAAGRLAERPILGRDVFVRDFLGEEIPEGEMAITELSLADLISGTFWRTCRRGRASRSSWTVSPWRTPSPSSSTG
jgi:segregation and condensation protein A